MDQSISKQEQNIQIKRVLYILDQILFKLKVLSNLPLFLENDGEALRKHFDDDKKIDFILQVVLAFENKISLDDMKLNTKLSDLVMDIHETKPFLVVPPNFTFLQSEEVDPHVYQLVDLLCNNKSLVQDLTLQETSNFVEFSEEIKKFRQVVSDKLQLLSEDYAGGSDKELRYAFRANQEMDKVLTSLETSIKNQRDDLGRQVVLKTEEYETACHNLEIVKRKFNFQIKKQNEESESKMTSYTIESQQKQAILKTQFEEVEAQFEKLLDQNLNEENRLKSLKLKVFSQLQSWIQKYDQEMTDKQAELETIEEQYLEESKAMDELQKQFNDIQEEYLILRKEKDEEDERIRNEIIYNYIVNRAATKIQRCWRAYHERRMLRKKKKKTSKGKKKKHN